MMFLPLVPTHNPPLDAGPKYEIVYRGRHAGMLRVVSSPNGELILPKPGDEAAEMYYSPPGYRGTELPRLASNERWLIIPGRGLCRVSQDASGLTFRYVDPNFVERERGQLPPGVILFSDHHFSIQDNGNYIRDGVALALPKFPVATSGMSYETMAKGKQFLCRYFVNHPEDIMGSYAGFGVFRDGKWDCPPVPKKYRHAFGARLSWNGDVLVTLSNDRLGNYGGPLLDGVDGEGAQAFRGPLRLYRKGTWSEVESPSWSLKGFGKGQFWPYERFPDHQIGAVRFRSADGRVETSIAAAKTNGKWFRLSELVRKAPPELDKYKVLSVYDRFVLVKRTVSESGSQPTDFVLLRRED